MGIGHDFVWLKGHAWAFPYTMESRSYCHYFGRMPQSCASFCYSASDLVWKTMVMQEVPTICCLDFAHLGPVRILQATSGGWSLMLAEFKFLLLWHCYKEEIQMSSSRDRTASPASILKRNDESQNFQQPIYPFPLVETGSI